VRSIIQRSSGNTVIIAQVIQLEAEDLLTVHPLRTYDAVPLASALESNIRLVASGLSPLTFVAADARLLVAAATEGLMTEDPNAHAHPSNSLRPPRSQEVVRLLNLPEPTIQHSAWVDVHQSHRVHDAN